MLAYYRPRHEGTYIPNLRSSFKACDSSLRYDHNDRFCTARQDLKALRQLAFASSDHDMLVTTAYKLRTTDLVQKLLQASPHATNQSRNLWEDICLLGRLRVVFEKFEEVCRKLPSFSKVVITPICPGTETREALQNPLSLRDVFGLLDVPLDKSGIRKVLGPEWTLAKAQKRFTQLQKQKLNIHAEVQMALYFSQDGRSLDQLFPYFGCSKYSCFMCWRFL